MKRMMSMTAVVLATLLGLAVVWQFSLALLLFGLSLFVAAAIRPNVDALVARGVAKTHARLLLVVGGSGLLLLTGLLLGNGVVKELNTAANLTVARYEHLYRSWEVGAAWQQVAVRTLPRPLVITDAPDAVLEQVLPALLTFSRGLATTVGGIALVLVLSIYWSVDQHRFERLWLSLLPVRRRAYARDVWRSVEAGVSHYARSQAVQSVLAAVLLGGGSALFKADFPLLLALVGALAAFVPLFGGVLAALVAYGLGTFSTAALPLGLALYTLVVFLFLELFVEPRLWTRERRSFLMTLLVALPLLETHGLWGLTLAPLLAVALEVLIRSTYQRQIARRATMVHIGELEARLARLQRQAAADGAVKPELASLIGRLVELVGQSRALQAER